MNATDPKIDERLPVWQALSQLFLDTELQEGDFARIADVLASSPYSEDKIEEILRFEVTPACHWNLLSVAGEWVGFNDEWLREKISPKMDTRPWLRWPISRMIRKDWNRTRNKFIELRSHSKALSESPRSA